MITLYFRVSQASTVMADAAAAVASVLSSQAILSALTILNLTDFNYPQDAPIKDCDIFDFVIIGSGAGGSTVANRLSEDSNTNVLVVECGGPPPLESRLPGLLTLLSNSKHDCNLTTTNDGYAAQNIDGGTIKMTAGKTLGGTSSIDYMTYVRGVAADYDEWAQIANDNGWSSANMLQYFKKSETCLSSDILEAYPSYHGTEGPLRIAKQPSEYNTDIRAALAEIGQPKILDITANDSIGNTEPLLLIADSYRQSAAETYLSQAKDRGNLYVKMNTCVTKINFDCNKTATSVELTTSSGEIMTIFVSKEVIVSAGAVHSPQLLMNSGIGPKSHLEEMGIEVLADLPVGQNLIDQPAAVMLIKLDESNRTVISNPYKFPAPVTLGNGALNKSQSRPDYQSINFVFEPKSSGLKQMCSWVFKYNSDICQPYYDANEYNNVFFLVPYFLHPESRGQVLLNSSDPAVAPIVELGLYSNETDLDNMAKCLKDLAGILNSTYCKSVNAELVDPNLEKCKNYGANSLDYWKCYALEMSTSPWHYSSTCAIGKVLESNLKVIGFSNVRVVDGSSMPTTVSGKILATIYALAERAADLIKADWNLC